MNTASDVEIGHRFFVAIATGRYDDPGWDALDVDGEVDTMRGWLCDPGLGERRFTHTHEELAANPTKQQIRDALENPRDRWTHTDAAVLFVTGHGHLDDRGHFTVLEHTDPERMPSTAQPTAELLAWLADTGIEHLLVVVDTCDAGGVAGDVLRLRDRTGLPQGWLVIPSATAGQEAVAGVFTGAVTRFLKSLASAEGAKDPGPGVDYLTGQAFLDGIRAHLDDPRQEIKPLYGSELGKHLCLPNPHYKQAALDLAPARHDLALPRDDLATHWAPRARGVKTDDQPGWLFSGRIDLMKALIAAATGPAAATVVTGGPGSGKSAALARLVTLTDPQFREQYADELADVPDDLMPGLGAVDVAVLATGKPPEQILAQIGRALQVPGPRTDDNYVTFKERLAAWHQWLAGRQQPVTIVIDAIDEADQPTTLIRDLLAELDPDHQRVRLIVGVRSRPPDDTQPPAQDLALATITALQAREIAVDHDQWWQDDDLTGYLTNILLHTAGSPYPADPTHAAAVAASFTPRTGRSFLIARLIAESLADRPTVIAVNDPAWNAALADGVVGVVRQDLHNGRLDADQRRRAVVLLRATAFAHGAGLPWGDIWPVVAHAVDDDDGYYGDADIVWLLHDRLGGYLTTSVEDDTTVYRPFHDLLRHTLRTQWRTLLTPPEEPS